MVTFVGVLQAIALGTTTSVVAKIVSDRIIDNIEAKQPSDAIAARQEFEPVKRKTSVTIQDVNTGTGSVSAANLRTSDRGLGLIKSYEGFRTAAYDDQQPNATISRATQVRGVLTIGYGHTGSDVFVGQRIDERKATELLKKDVRTAEDTVRRYVKVRINQPQFDALVSFVYNVGSGQFSKSTLLRKLNRGDIVGAEKEFPRWSYDNGQFLKGLENRRFAELAVFQGVA